MRFEENKNLIHEFVSKESYEFGIYNKDNTYYDGTPLNKSNAEKLFEIIKDSIYLISPNPVDKSFILLCYEVDDKLTYFTRYNDSYKVQKRLKKQYNKLFEGFRSFYNYDNFIRNIYHFIEEKRTSNNILLGNSYIFDAESMEFSKEVDKLPICYTELKYTELTEDTEETLNYWFNLMYTEDKEMDCFLYYILCNFKKEYASQSLFLIIDESGVGKTSKILPFVKVGLNKILDTGLLKQTELYNISNSNSVIYNEANNNTNKNNMNGAVIVNLVDNAPLTVTRKSDSALTIQDNEKPLVQIMAESLPFISALNNGMLRRMLLVPKVSSNFKKLKNKTENTEIEINKFFYILNEKPIECIQYYKNRIDICNIEENAQDIKEKMVVSLTDLEELQELKENVFSKYFNLEPLAKDEIENVENESAYLIGSEESLDTLLMYIDKNFITTNHFNNDKIRKKYLQRIIKENTSLRLTDFGRTSIQDNNRKENCSYAYQLTKEGIELVEEINKTLEESKQILFRRVS